MSSPLAQEKVVMNINLKLSTIRNYNYIAHDIICHVYSHIIIIIGNSFLCSFWLEDIRTKEQFNAAATIYVSILKI